MKHFLNLAEDNAHVYQLIDLIGIITGLKCCNSDQMMLFDIINTSSEKYNCRPKNAFFILVGKVIQSGVVALLVNLLA